MSMRPPLACTVRDCARPLEPGPTLWSCTAGHSFDVARSGYVNLLQPQDRRSSVAGDSADAVSARSRLLAAGVGVGLLSDVVAQVATDAVPGACVADLGCGGGEFLGALQNAADVIGVGVDLSTHAATAAARAFPRLTWVVANADRRLPFTDASLDVIVSINGRRNPAECHRVLKADGHLVLAVPATDDLVELRQAVLGGRVERDRVETSVTEHDALFVLDRRIGHRDERLLTPEQLRDLLTGTYRGARHAVHERRDQLTDLRVTLASDILVFTPRRDRRD